MELTISLKEENKLSFLVELLQEFDFIEILDIKENETVLYSEHMQLLSDRLKNIEEGTAHFRSWDLIKTQYEKN